MKRNSGKNAMRSSRGILWMMTSNSLSFDPGADSYDATYGFPPGVGEVVAAQIRAAGKLTTEYHLLEIGAGTGRVLCR